LPPRGFAFRVVPLELPVLFVSLPELVVVPTDPVDCLGGGFTEARPVSPELPLGTNPRPFTMRPDLGRESSSSPPGLIMMICGPRP
jgi:hypothetical protein